MSKTDAVYQQAYSKGFQRGLDLALHQKETMITVAILINGQPIFARSGTNTGQLAPDGSTIYQTDNGDTILHHREEGAVPLAIKLLQTIREP